MVDQSQFGTTGYGTCPLARPALAHHKGITKKAHSIGGALGTVVMQGSKPDAVFFTAYPHATRYDFLCQHVFFVLRKKINLGLLGQSFLHLPLHSGFEFCVALF